MKGKFRVPGKGGLVWPCIVFTGRPKRKSTRRSVASSSAQATWSQADCWKIGKKGTAGSSWKREPINVSFFSILFISIYHFGFGCVRGISWKWLWLGVHSTKVLFRTLDEASWSIQQTNEKNHTRAPLMQFKQLWSGLDDTNIQVWDWLWLFIQLPHPNRRKNRFFPNTTWFHSTKMQASTSTRKFPPHHQMNIITKSPTLGLKKNREILKLLATPTQSGPHLGLITDGHLS